MTEQALVTELRAAAAGVLMGFCRADHWIGLERDDLVGEGWLAYQRALATATPARGDAHVYARNAAWHRMRSAAARWLRDRSGPSLVQVETLEAPAPAAAPPAEASPLEAEAAYLLNALSPVRRAVVVALYYDVLTIQETAAVVAVTPAAVSRHRYLALEQLRASAGRPSEAWQQAAARTKLWRAAHPDAARAIAARYNATPARKASNRASKARSRGAACKQPLD